MATVLITGASSGIGKSLAFEFAKGGYDLAIVGRDKATLEAAADEIRGLHSVHIRCMEHDLADPDAPKRIFDQCEQDNLDIEILVNDAGMAHHGKFFDVPLDEHIEVIRINIEALTSLTSLFLPQMLERKSGKILNMGSIAGFQPGPLLGVYSATKAYVVSLSETLMEELKDTGVTVTCLCPGPVATDFFNKADMLDTVVYKKLQAMHMSPEEVAQAGYEALMSGEQVIIPGAVNKIITFSRRVMPAAMQAKAQRLFYEETEG